MENVNDAQVIFSDGSIKSIDNKDSEIEVRSNGEIVIESDTVIHETPAKEKSKLTHIVMPYGKQTQLQLPDGSTVYVNSGSKLSFPTQFTGNTREIYLLGEAYLRVQQDVHKPFIVHTPEMDVHVTGTEFNVSAYPDDDFVQTVLLEGKVSVRKNGMFSSAIEIVPGEGAFMNKKSGEVTTERVETNQYASWIYGYIICNNERIEEITKKIERYYNCKINIPANISAITFSGKLDLKEDVQKVLETVAFASSLKMEQTENGYELKN